MTPYQYMPIGTAYYLICATDFSELSEAGMADLKVLGQRLIWITAP